jgi:hypothetical protein
MNSDYNASPCVILCAMSLSRRQFFHRLVRPGQKTPEERLVRYQLMDNYVRTQLLPYDFALTLEQESELFASVRSELETTSDEELFSAILRFKVEEAVDRKMRPWREENHLKEQANRLKEIRQAAEGYVNAFLNAQATPAAVEQLRTRFGMTDPIALEGEIMRRVRDWIATVDDSELVHLDVVSVRDLVFAELRSWC